MRRLRLSIAQLMLLVLFIGLAIGALRSPSRLMANAMWTATAGLLGWSVVAAILRRDHRRAFWVGFAVFGWLHLIVIFELYRANSADRNLLPLPSLLTSDLIDHLRNHVPPPQTGGVFVDTTFIIRHVSYTFPYLEFGQIAHLIMTLVVAWVGGRMGRLAAGWSSSPASNKVERPE